MSKYNRKTHSEIGERILNNLSFLGNVPKIIRHHHERYDGRGYPDRLKAEEIEIESRIICVADTIDTMSTNRPYRSALSEEVILEELKKCSGSQFDSDFSRVAMEFIRKGGLEPEMATNQAHHILVKS